MLYSCDSILMCMTNLLICTFIHLNLIAFFKKAHKHAHPRTVTEPLTQSNTETKYHHSCSYFHTILVN